MASCASELAYSTPRALKALHSYVSYSGENTFGFEEL